MKSLALKFSEVQLIEQVIQQNRLAQKQLFEHFSPKMLGVCRQYTKNLHDAEEVMLHAFMKIFQHIGQFNNDGSFEGWIRQVMIRECISFLRQKKELAFVDDINPNLLTKLHSEQDHSEDYQALIDALPNGCKHIFILYVIEGYKHHEIAEMLHISVGTSKSQLAYAKKILKKHIKNTDDERF